MSDSPLQSPQFLSRFRLLAMVTATALLSIWLLAPIVLDHFSAETSTPNLQTQEDLNALEPGTEASLQSSSTKSVLIVSGGDTLSSIFKSRGLDQRILDEVISSSPQARQVNNLYPGYSLTFEENENKDLISIEVVKSPLESFKFTREGNHFTFSHIEREPEIKQVMRQAVITESLFVAAQKGGIPTAMTLELASIFGGVIDFILDVRKGDTFKLVYEEKLLDGKKIGFGKILAAEFINQGKSFVAIRHESKDGTSGFYNAIGQSMRKAFLLNPVDFTRISDGFSLARKHPILNLIRAHKGTDYSAPTGTPVIATADGKVTFAGSNGSFGNLIVLQHGEHFETKYAHLSAFSKIAKNGARIRQGETIGFVGATGAATGPHLHYELLIDGKHRDSRKVFDKLPQAETLSAVEMEAFKNQTQELLKQMGGIKTTQALASNKDSIEKNESELSCAVKLKKTCHNRK